jgi:CelD/BcsL family acetyltransferase involved in cellulose biosynthesis
MDTRIVSSLDDVGLDERGWNGLVAQGRTNSVFQTHEWMRSWIEAFGDSAAPLFVVVRLHDQVAGVAPMVAYSRSARRVIRFLGDGRSDYCDLLVSREDREVESAALRALIEDANWDIIELNGVPSGSGTIQGVVESCRLHGCRSIVERQYLCPTLVIAGREEAARLISNKPSLRRTVNRFKRDGCLSYRHLTTTTEVTPHLESFFAQHVARWARAGGRSLFLDENNRSFYRRLTANLGSTGWLLFSIVEFNGQPIAFHYGFDYDEAVMWYKPSFSVAYAPRSPGLVMVRELISYAIAHGRRELDFTVGEEAFKKRFTNHCRATTHVRIYRDPVRYGVALASGWMARVTRRFPRFHRLTRRNTLAER